MDGLRTHGDLSSPVWARNSRRNFAVAFNSVVIWKLANRRNQGICIHKPKSLLLNARVFLWLVLSYLEIRPGCDNNLSTRRESHRKENTSTILADISAKRLVNKRLSRQMVRFSIVNSHINSACIRTILPDTFSQQEAVSIGRPIDEVNVVPE